MKKWLNRNKILGVFLDMKFVAHPLRYIIQCTAAAGFIFVVLQFLDLVKTPALVAALGASTFVAFTMPQYYLAKPRSLIGGYVIGILSGILSKFVILDIVEHQFVYCQNAVILSATIAVGITIFVMAITNTEHAPSAGVSLGMVLNSFSVMDIVFLLSAITFLALIVSFAKKYMMDLRTGTMLELEHNEPE